MWEYNIIKIIGSKLRKYIYIIVSNIFWFFSWFIIFFGMSIIAVVAVILIIIYWLLTFFFQPLVPYNKQDVLFESFLVSKKQNYYTEYVNNYKTICKRNFYQNLSFTWLKAYTGKISLCKNPINLTPVDPSADWWLSKKEKLIRWVTIERIAEQLSKIMIFKNWLSWKYKLTRVNANKIKIVGINKNNKLDDINIYNPFLLSDSWIFIENSDLGWWITYKDKILSKSRYRLDFQDNSEQQKFKKIYNINNNKDWWLEIEKNYKVKKADFDYDIYIPPSIKDTPKLRQQFIEQFKTQYNPVIYSTYSNLLSAYDKVSEKWWPKKITMCYDKPVKIPYFIKNKLQKNYNEYAENWSYNDIEKYNQYWLVCITVNNIYSKLDSKNSWRTSSFIVKLWQAVDVDVSVNIYNLTYIYKNIVSKYSSKIQKRFLKRYKTKLKDNYRTIYMLKWYMRDEKINSDYLDFSYDKNRYTIKYTLANMWPIRDRHKETVIKNRSVNYGYTDITINRQSNKVSRQRTYSQWYWNDFTIENLYFSYLNNLLFNIGNKDVMKDLDEQPQYLFNFWNLYDKNSFNFYYWYLVNSRITKEQNSSSFWNIFNLTNDNKDKLSILNFYNYWEKNLGNNNTYYNQVIKPYNLPDLKWKNALSLSMFNADKEIEQIWISPLFMFFQIPQWNNKKKQKFSKYYQTQFENFNYLFNIDKFKKLYKNISQLLQTNYIKSRFDTDLTTNFDLADKKWLARLYKGYDADGKIQKISDYIDNKTQINKSLKDYINSQITGWVIWWNTAIDITTQIAMENQYFKDYWCNYNLEKTVKFLKDKKVNKTFYTVSWWKSTSNNILCYLWNANACKEQQQVKLTKCENWLFKLYSFIQHLLQIKLYLQDLVNFQETHRIKNFTLLNTVLNKSYLFNHTYLTNSSFSSEYLSNDFFKILWINIFDKDKINEYKKKITLSKYNFWKVTDEFIQEIKNINCNKLLNDNNITVNQWNINTCERWKIALVKYFQSWISLSQAKTYLEWLNKNWKQEQVFQILLNYWIAWQCTWFVQWKYPEINFGWNAKQWCNNASKKWRPVIYNAWSVWTGAVIVRDWWKYGHVGIVEKVDRQNKRILINDMNWKWPFIETHHWMKLYHPNFECYIKIR